MHLEIESPETANYCNNEDLERYDARIGFSHSTFIANGNESIASALKKDYPVLKGKELDALTTKRKAKHRKKDNPTFKY